MMQQGMVLIYLTPLFRLAKLMFMRLKWSINRVFLMGNFLGGARDFLSEDSLHSLILGQLHDRFFFNLLSFMHRNLFLFRDTLIPLLQSENLEYKTLIAEEWM